MNTSTQTATGESAKQITQFTYTPTAQLASAVTHDNITSAFCYYPDAVPDLKTLFGELKLADKDIKLIDAMHLEAPSAQASLPLLARCQFQTFADGSVLHTGITLYGYEAVAEDKVSVKSGDTVLSIEGVDVDISKKPWVITKTAGRELLISLADSRNEGAGVTEYRQTTWYGSNACRQLKVVKNQIVVLQNALSNVTTFETSSRPAGKDIEPLGSGTLGNRILSTYTGRVMRDVSVNEQLQPEQFRQFSYDSLGRETGVEVFAWDAAAFKKLDAVDAKPATPLATQTITRKNTVAGTQVTVLGPDGRSGRTLYDGLQRPVRYEIQRQANNDHSASNYCLLQETTYAPNGEVHAQRLYDYLPGGLRRISEAALPESLNDWFWQGHNTSIAKAESEESITVETGTGTFKNGLLATEQQRQTNKKNGDISRSFKRWKSNETAEVNSSVAREETYNRLGQLVSFKEALPKASNASDREWKMAYDGLNRRASLTAPDSSIVKWEYKNFSTEPVQVSVTKGDKTYVLGSQTLTQGNVTELRRGGGATQTWRLVDNCAVTPDQTRLFSETSTDGNSVSWYSEKAEVLESKKLLATFTFDPLKRAVASTCAAANDDSASAAGAITTRSIEPEILGTYRLERDVRGVTQNVGLPRSLRGRLLAVRQADGIETQTWHDGLGRLSRSRRGHLEYLYRYDAFGACEQLIVQDLRSGHRQTVDFAFNDAGLEIAREYRLNSQLKTRYEQAWSATGQLLSKALYRDGTTSAVRTETFTYDPLRDWLLTWTVTGEAVKDAQNREVFGQTYTYDVLDNVIRCETKLADKKTETLVYTYDEDFPTRRKSVTKDAENPVVLTYDENGNLSKNERGEQLAYTVTGQLSSVTDTADKVLTRYEYDARGNLASQWDAVKQQRRVLIYTGSVLTGEVLLDKTGKQLKRRRLDDESGLVVQTEENGQERTLFLHADPQHGGGDEYEQSSSGVWTTRNLSFTPWGEAPLAQLNAMESGAGYNGQRPDPVTGTYHLGNGYRCYNPQEKGFAQTDSWSPFGAAGLNDRAYCGGDPVNRHDPSGHIMISRHGAAEELAQLDQMIRDTTPAPPEEVSMGRWMKAIIFGALAIAIAVASAGLAAPLSAGLFALAVFSLIATITATALELASLSYESSNPRLSAMLGEASFWVGMADVATGLAGAGKALGKMSMKVGVRAARGMRTVVQRFKPRSLVTLPRLVNQAPPSKIGGLIDRVRGAASNLMDSAGVASSSRAASNLQVDRQVLGDKFELYTVRDRISNRLIIESHGEKKILGGKTTVPEGSLLNYYAPEGEKLVSYTYGEVRGKAKLVIKGKTLVEGDVLEHGNAEASRLIARGRHAPSETVAGGMFTNNYQLSYFSSRTVDSIESIVKTYGVDFIRPLPVKEKIFTEAATSLNRVFDELKKGGKTYSVYEASFCRTKPFSTNSLSRMME